MAGPLSLARIRRSMDATKSFLGCDIEVPWHLTYYQYANRLAALYFFD